MTKDEVIKLFKDLVFTLDGIVNIENSPVRVKIVDHDDNTDVCVVALDSDTIEFCYDKFLEMQEELLDMELETEDEGFIAYILALLISERLAFLDAADVVDYDAVTAYSYKCLGINSYYIKETIKKTIPDTKDETFDIIIKTIARGSDEEAAQRYHSRSLAQHIMYILGTLVDSSSALYSARRLPAKTLESILAKIEKHFDMPDGTVIIDFGGKWLLVRSFGKDACSANKFNYFFNKFIDKHDGKMLAMTSATNKVDGKELLISIKEVE